MSSRGSPKTGSAAPQTPPSPKGGDDEQEMEDEGILMWGCKCPIGGCPKQGKWLGQKQAWYSERRARQAVFDHIVGSPAHKDLSEDDAASQTDCAEVQSWVVSNSDEALQADTRSNAASAEELALWADEAVTYENPDQRSKRPRPAGGGSDSGKRARPKHQPPQPGPSSASSAIAKRARTPPRGPTGQQAIASVSNRLEDQIAQQTKTAYTFVRVASQDKPPFED